MKVIPTALPEVLIIEAQRFGDARGYFIETFQLQRYQAAGINLPFVQDNLSRSRHGSLRGLHLQNPRPQGKLVSVLEGEVYDVAVDVRLGSPTFGKWVGVTLSAENHRQMWIPPGFAHGFCVTSESALFFYKCTDLYSPESELGILHDDPSLAIPWPVKAPLLSDKDRKNPRLSEIDPARLPGYGKVR
ncbi:MAG: dTDP-4-dehydrorhamnose 3,5-epimerase [Gammaproteobacteria bacterium]|nr:dTDP-4-dehydrorhamnose 3,5-epimerase [Gammaproteobacteria bacterium]